eukprot:scaffold4137_cov93-Isochrysis_galbana.AAC.2
MRGCQALDAPGHRQRMRGLALLLDRLDQARQRLQRAVLLPGWPERGVPRAQPRRGGSSRSAARRAHRVQQETESVQHTAAACAVRLCAVKRAAQLWHAAEQLQHRVQIASAAEVAKRRDAERIVGRRRPQARRCRRRGCGLGGRAHRRLGLEGQARAAHFPRAQRAGSPEIEQGTSRWSSFAPMAPPPVIPRPAPAVSAPDGPPIPEFMWCQRSDRVYVTIKASRTRITTGQLPALHTPPAHPSGQASASGARLRHAASAERLCCRSTAPLHCALRLDAACSQRPSLHCLRRATSASLRRAGRGAQPPSPPPGGRLLRSARGRVGRRLPHVRGLRPRRPRHPRLLPLRPLGLLSPCRPKPLVRLWPVSPCPVGEGRAGTVLAGAAGQGRQAAPVQGRLAVLDR